MSGKLYAFCVIVKMLTNNFKETLYLQKLAWYVA